MFNLILAFIMIAVAIGFIFIFLMETVFLIKDLGRRLNNIPEQFRSFHRNWLIRTFLVRMGGIGIILFLVEATAWSYIGQTL